MGEDLGAETDDALIEVHRDSSSLRPKRGLGTLGKIGGTLDSIVQWIAHELRLTGSGDVDAQHSALRVQLTNESTGAITANGELRAGDFEVVNEDGDTPQAGKAVGLRAAVHNTADGIVEQAIGIEVDVQDENTTTPVDTLIGIKINDVGSDNIALQIGTGKVGIGTNNPQSMFDVFDETYLDTDLADERVLAWLRGRGNTSAPSQEAGLRISEIRRVAGNTNSSLGVRLAWAPDHDAGNSNEGRLFFQMANTHDAALNNQEFLWGKDAPIGSAGTTLMKLNRDGILAVVGGIVGKLFQSGTDRTTIAASASHNLFAPEAATQWIVASHTENTGGYLENRISAVFVDGAGNISVRSLAGGTHTHSASGGYVQVTNGNGTWSRTIDSMWIRLY